MGWIGTHVSGGENAVLHVSCSGSSVRHISVVAKKCATIHRYPCVERKQDLQSTQSASLLRLRGGAAERANSGFTYALAGVALLVELIPRLLVCPVLLTAPESCGRVSPRTTERDREAPQPQLLRHNPNRRAGEHVAAWLYPPRSVRLVC